ncbi:hypothetical protein NL676_020630 [Syzygium grande]|nr:hypothetical protein NL676_020630 [Syzygium grande]
MANQAEIAAMIDEKLKEHMNTINEQITAAMSKMMSDLMTKQQQINVASQSEIPPPTRQGLRLDKSPAINTDPTLQLDDAILIDTSASPSVPVLIHPPMMRIPSCWPNSTKEDASSGPETTIYHPASNLLWAARPAGLTPKNANLARFTLHTGHYLKEAANKAMIVTEAEQEQVKVPYHLPSTTPFIRLELWEDMSI